MGYLQELKKYNKKYLLYLEIKKIVRNTFSNLKIHYEYQNQLIFERLDEDYQYIIKKSETNVDDFIIRDNLRNSFSIKLNKNNIKEITHLIDQTAPNTFNPSQRRFNLKLNNIYGAKKYDNNDLLNLVVWKQNPLCKKRNKLQVDNDYMYCGDSKVEIKVVEYLLSKGIAKLLRGQDYPIKYDEKVYYPDIIYLNHLNQIVILEVKGKSDFSVESNVKKYIALAKHCIENRFVYGIVDVNYNTMKSYYNLTINKKFEKEVLLELKKNKIFTSQSFTKLRNEKFPNLKRKILAKMLTKIVIYNKLINRPKTVHDLNILNKQLEIEDYHMLFRDN